MEALLIICLLAVLGIYLLTKRWVWIVLLSVSSVATLFSMVAAIIHFQIVLAVGMFFLLGFLVAGLVFASEGL